MSELLDHLLKPQCRYGELKPGEQFRFPGSQITHTKTKSGYKSPGSDHTWDTGKKVAVIPVHKTGEPSL